MHSILKDKKAIFFDVGYTLDRPASGDWMFTNRFMELAGDRLRQRGAGEIRKAREAGNAYSQVAEEFTKHVKDLLYFEPQKQSKGYDYVDLWLNDDIRASSVFQNLVSLGRTMCEASEKLIRACQQMVGIMEDVRSAAAVQRDIASLALKLKEIVNSCELILFQGSAAYA